MHVGAVDDVDEVLGYNHERNVQEVSSIYNFSSSEMSQCVVRLD